jgi:hypothetical protein
MLKVEIASKQYFPCHCNHVFKKSGQTLPFRIKCSMFQLKKLTILILIWLENYGRIVGLTGSASAIRIRHLGLKLTFNYNTKLRFNDSSYFKFYNFLYMYLGVRSGHPGCIQRYGCGGYTSPRRQRRRSLRRPTVPSGGGHA